jgi:hypothetical protein
MMLLDCPGSSHLHRPWPSAILLVSLVIAGFAIADLMLDRGDLEGRTVWKRIRRAIIELQAPPTGPAH